MLGATVLAIGNSLGDLYNNSSLASLGLGVMACTGTISGQLFNLLVGLGLNFSRQMANKPAGVGGSNHQQAVRFDLFGGTERQKSTFAVIITVATLANLSILLFVSRQAAGSLSKKMGAYLVLWYTFVLLACAAVYALLY